MRRLFVICSVSVVPMLLPQAAPQAAPKPANPGVIVDIHDREGDRITSDGHGPYVNGVGKVEGQIWTSGSGDMTLQLRFARPNRVFNGVFTPDPNIAQPSNAPSGSFANGWFINVARIWQIGVGDTVSTGASFSGGPGDFRWCVSTCFGGVSELVTVTRNSPTSWTVSADPASPDTAGNDLSVLLNPLKGWEVRGFYRMPFELTIACSNPTCQ